MPGDNSPKVMTEGHLSAAGPTCGTPPAGKV